MWWLIFSVLLLVLSGAIWRWGVVALVLCFITILLMFQTSSALHQLPLAYYKGGGDGGFGLHWVWVIHSLIWSAAVYASVFVAKRMHKLIFR